MTKLMPWVGGKAQLMWAIQMLLPTHYKTLVDVFGGSGIITMNTSVPSGCLQIYNDLNHDLYNLLFCAKERPLELVRELGFLPINAHDEFDVLQRQLQGEDFTMEYMERQLDLTEVFFEPPHGEVVRQLLLERGSLGNVRRAAAFYKLQRYSYNGSGDSYGVGSCDIRRFFRDLWECSHRLKDAVLENKDFESIITARNDPQTVVYSYLPKSVKAQVDAIVERLAQLPEVAACYDQWWQLKDEIAGYYGQNTPPRQPLTQRKEFRSLKNWIIREAEDISFSPSADSVEPGEKQSTEKTPPIRGSADVQPVGEAVSARHIPANAVMRLLHHMGQIFRTSMPVIPPALRIDSKRRRRLQEKRMAMGHKRNDHEDEQLHHVNDNTMR